MCSPTRLHGTGTLHHPTPCRRTPPPTRTTTATRSVPSKLAKHTFVDSSFQLARLDDARSDHSEAIRNWLRILDVDPYDEDAHLGLIRSLLAQRRHVRRGGPIAPAAPGSPTSTWTRPRSRSWRPAPRRRRRDGRPRSPPEHRRNVTGTSGRTMPATCADPRASYTSCSSPRTPSTPPGPGRSARAARCVTCVWPGRGNVPLPTLVDEHGHAGGGLIPRDLSAPQGTFRAVRTLARWTPRTR